MFNVVICFIVFEFVLNLIGNVIIENNIVNDIKLVLIYKVVELNVLFIVVKIIFNMMII